MPIVDQPLTDLYNNCNTTRIFTYTYPQQHMQHGTLHESPIMPFILDYRTRRDQTSDYTVHNDNATVELRRDVTLTDGAPTNGTPFKRYLKQGLITLADYTAPL